jgi:hypothetical protein
MSNTSPGSFDPKQPRSKRKVGGTADWEELGQTLNNGENNNLIDGHEEEAYNNSTIARANQPRCTSKELHCG